MQIIEASNKMLNRVPTGFKRFLFSQINWSERLIEISGSRGVGKTTLMLQKAYELNKGKTGKAVYFSLDHPHFYNNSLLDTADYLLKEGYDTLFLDEIHKYPAKSPYHDWSMEIKTIYDLYPELNVIYSGSSILKLYKGQGDLSRRLSAYILPGMSFREYLEFRGIFSGVQYTLQEILKDNEEISNNISAKFKPIPHFREYLKYGYYPFFVDSPDNYFNRLNSIISVILESDIPSVSEISFETVSKIKRLLLLLSGSVPFTPNLSQLGKDLAITDQRTLLKYMNYLDKAELISIISKEAYGNQLLRKPEKVYMNNTNLMEAINPATNPGTIRETFFLSQLKVNHDVKYPKKGDFLIDDENVIEVGGKNKTVKQIQSVRNSFLALDQIEAGYGRTIPLWLFGFIY